MQQVVSCPQNLLWGHLMMLTMKISPTSMSAMILVGVLQWNHKLIPLKLTKLGYSLIPHLINIPFERNGYLSANQALMVRAYTSKLIWLLVGSSSVHA
jgi:hypothetical protein